MASRFDQRVYLNTCLIELFMVVIFQVVLSQISGVGIDLITGLAFELPPYLEVLKIFGLALAMEAKGMSIHVEG